jgi:heme exporter protein A
LKTTLRLVATNLACSRGERPLFAGLGFTIQSGGILLVTGPNGIGKTTLLRLIAGFIRPDHGSIGIDGAETAETTIAESAHFVGHRDGLKGALTVRENLDAAPAFYGEPGIPVADAARRLDLLRLLDLPVGVLSAGQRRRVAMARLLVARRPIWLLDEPTAALDAASSSVVSALIGEHAASGGIVVAATHLDLGLDAIELAFSQDGTARLGAGAA